AHTDTKEPDNARRNLPDPAGDPGAIEPAERLDHGGERYPLRPDHAAPALTLERSRRARAASRPKADISAFGEFVCEVATSSTSLPLGRKPQPTRADIAKIADQA